MLPCSCLKFQSFQLITSVKILHSKMLPTVFFALFALKASWNILKTLSALAIFTKSNAIIYMYIYTSSCDGSVVENCTCIEDDEYFIVYLSHLKAEAYLMVSNSVTLESRKVRSLRLGLVSLTNFGSFFTFEAKIS